jgi:hypothetical protein
MNTTFERVKKEDGGTNEWLTPPQIIKALGEFDLDPCAPVTRPWDMAKKHYTIKDDGLLLPWEGRVWCNPPYGDEAKYWLAKCAKYGNCIALTFARTETRMFFESVWPKAHAMLFFQGRLKFHRVTGEPGDSAGAPSVLIAYDQANAEVLAKSGLPGKLINLNDQKLSNTN